MSRKSIMQRLKLEEQLQRPERRTFWIMNRKKMWEVAPEFFAAERARLIAEGKAKETDEFRIFKWLPPE